MSQNIPPPLPPPRSRAEDDTIRKILAQMKSVAVVGISANPARDSYRVAAFLQGHKISILPVNPALDSVLGERAYASLDDLPERVDVVDVFRRPEAAPAIAEQAVRIGACALWLQEGVISEEAADIAQRAGLDVVIDRCILKETIRIDTEPSK